MKRKVSKGHLSGFNIYVNLVQIFAIMQATLEIWKPRGEGHCPPRRAHRLLKPTFEFNCSGWIDDANAFGNLPDCDKERYELVMLPPL